MVGEGAVEGAKGLLELNGKKDGDEVALVVEIGEHTRTR